MPATNVHCKWHRGNLLFYDGHRKRILDAYGPNVVKWELARGGPPKDNTTNDPTGATCTMVEVAGANAITGGDTMGVSMKIVNATNEYDGPNIQWHGTPFQLVANKPTYFGCKMAVNHATSIDMFVGLSKTRTTILKDVGSAAHGLHASTKSIVGFYKIDATTATKYITGNTSSTSSSSAGTLDTSAHIYEWYHNGANQIDFYVDGTNVGTVTSTSDIPTVVMRPTLALKNGAAAARTTYVHWMRTIQLLET